MSSSPRGLVPSSSPPPPAVLWGSRCLLPPSVPIALPPSTQCTACLEEARVENPAPKIPCAGSLGEVGVQGGEPGPQFGVVGMGSTLLPGGYFQVPTVTAPNSLVQSPPAPLCGPGSGWDCELCVSVCPREGKGLLPFQVLAKFSAGTSSCRGWRSRLPSSCSLLKG